MDKKNIRTEKLQAWHFLFCLSYFLLFYFLSFGEEQEDVSQTIIDTQSEAEKTNLINAWGLSGEIVSQTIKYTQPEAAETYLIWGINGWQPLPTLGQPPGTILYENLMYTPMELKNETFVTDLKVSKGSTLEFGFWITKRRDKGALDNWDADSSKDFSSFSIKIAKDDLIHIESKLDLMQIELLVPIEIKYKIKNVEVMFLVWGINGWKNMFPGTQKKGTFINGSMYTPMSIDEDGMTAQINVPKGSTVDFCFVINRLSNKTIFSLNNDKQVSIWEKELHKIIADFQKKVTIEPSSDVTDKLRSFDLNRSLDAKVLIFLIIVCSVLFCKLVFPKIRRIF